MAVHDSKGNLNNPRTGTLDEAKSSMRKADSAPNLQGLEAAVLQEGTSSSTTIADAPKLGEMDMEGPINALSASPDGNLIIAAGRDVLKIVSVAANFEFSVYKNLRSGRNLNLNFSSNDVKWHPNEQYKHRIATSATNGAVVLWNIEKNASKQEKVLNDHKRTVNRITWHTENPELLLSGSQDGTMKIWDLREPDGVAKMTFQGQSESVRDVQFNPFYANYFAACFDNGNIQIWDLRKTAGCERNIQSAHQGLVAAIDWHPEDSSLIASAGRDRIIKVWDLTKPGKSIYTVQTIAPVGRIKWRPQNKFHIASCGSVFDFSIHVWDVKRPYIPYASSLGHKDVCAGFLFFKNSPDAMLSVGKDSKLLAHEMRNAYRPLRHIRATGLSWNVSNKLAAISDEVIREELPIKPQQLSTSGSSSISAAALPESTPSSSGVLSTLLTTLTPGKSTAQLNTSAAGSTAQNPAAASAAAHPKGIVRVYAIKKATSELDEGHAFQYLAQNYIFRGKPFADICQHNAAVAQEVERYQIAQTWQVLRLLYDQQPAPPSTPQAPSLPGASTKPPLTPSNSQKRINPLSSPVTPPLPNPTSAAEAIPIPPSPPVNLKLDSGPQIPSALLSKPAGNVPHRSSSFGIGNQGSLSSAANQSSAAFPKWDFEPQVHAMLEFYTNAGDVQMCVAVALALGSRVKIDPVLFQKWVHSYMDMLGRLQLWNVSNEVIKACKEPSIQVLNTISTTYHAGCPRCQKPLFRHGFECENCKQFTNTCSVCQLVVKGLYGWCQGCGHGGHVKHMDDWFAKNSACPAGCGHLCNYKPNVTRRSKPQSQSSSSSAIAPSSSSAAITAGP